MTRQSGDTNRGSKCEFRIFNRVADKVKADAKGYLNPCHGIFLEVRGTPKLTHDQIQKVDEKDIWPHKCPSKGSYENCGCGFPICVLIDSRPVRFE